MTGFADPVTVERPRPSQQFRQQRATPAEQLSDELETATDAYADACDLEAEAENAYLKAYAITFTTAECAATIRPKTAECAAVDERCAWNLALAVKNAKRAKVEELKHRLMAALGHQRFIREATGG